MDNDKRTTWNGNSSRRTEWENLKNPAKCNQGIFIYIFTRLNKSK